MMYFELLKSCQGKPPGIYCRERNRIRSIDIFKILAERIWEETGSGVSYLRYNGGDGCNVVDLEEFTFIKLKAIPL